MQIDKEAKLLLSHIFKNGLARSEGINVKRFRADNYQQRDILDRLESDRLLERRNDKYHLKLMALSELVDINEVKNVLSDCENLFQVLRSYYFEQTEEKICINCLKDLSCIQKERVYLCLSYMTEASIFRGWNLNRTEDDHVTPAEGILNYNNFFEILKEMQSWRNERPKSLSETLNLNQTIDSSPDEEISLSSILHPAIIAHAWPQYINGHLRDAVLNSVIAVFDLIRQKTGLKDDGDKLIGKALSLDDPYLILSELETESGQNDQKGFMQIYKGSFQGIRNPKAHSLSHDLTSDKTAQYLVFASLLARRVDEARLVKQES